MTEEAPARRTYVVGTWPLSRILMLIGAVFFVIGGFSFRGDITWGSPWSWVAFAFAAWMLAAVV
jgi:hypothetical protein